MTKRDNKDPMPLSGAAGSERNGFGGNARGVTREKDGSGTAEKVSVASRFSSNPPGPEQPGRAGGDGNTVPMQATESHGQKKTERVRPSQRF